MGTPTPKEIFSVFWAFLVETKKIAKGFLARNFKLELMIILIAFCHQIVKKFRRGKIFYKSFRRSPFGSCHSQKLEFQFYVIFKT